MAKRAKQTPQMSFEDLKRLAFSTAETTLTRLRQEVAILERTFPELATAKGRSKLAADAEEATRNWSDASRKAVSARMKRYWAARRRAEKKT